MNQMPALTGKTIDSPERRLRALTNFIDRQLQRTICKKKMHAHTEKETKTERDRDRR